MRENTYFPGSLAPVMLLACAVFGLASPATAQDDGPANGVVLKAHTESTESYPAEEDMLVGAREAGIRGSDIAGPLGGLLGALGDKAPIPEGKMADLKMLVAMGGYGLDQAIQKAGQPPEVESADVTIYIRPDLSRIEADEATMIWRPATASQGAGMWITDPSSGRLMAVDLNLMNSVAGQVAPGAEPRDYTIERVAGRAPEERLGHTVYLYRFSYTMPVDPSGIGAAMAGAGPGMGLNAGRIEASGTAWIAPDMPEGDDIAAFYTNFASSFGGQGMMGGLSSGMARMAELGVALETNDTTKAFIKRPVELESGAPGTIDVLVLQGTTHSVVTDVSRRPLDDEDFFGAEGEPPAGDPRSPAASPAPGVPPTPENCDCSCGAMKELEDLDEDDPDAMAKAMCAQQCVGQWMQCRQ